MSKTPFTELEELEDNESLGSVISSNYSEWLLEIDGRFLELSLVFLLIIIEEAQTESGEMVFF